MANNLKILSGDNSYDRDWALSEIIKSSKAAGFSVEKVEGDGLSLEGFADLAGGISLFSQKRLVIIKRLSENNLIWQKLPELIERISSDNKLVLVENKLDKRTKLYKDIAKLADIEEYKNLDAKDSGQLAEKVRQLGKKSGISISLSVANFLVYWVGLDERQIRLAMERLLIVGEISEKNIREFIPQNIEENSFGVFEAALKGNVKEVMQVISNLKISEGVDGGYQFFGLVSSQLFNLCALKIGLAEGKTVAEIAKSIGANAWALGKMENHARTISLDNLKLILRKMVDADSKLKSSSVDLWDLIESLLIELSAQNS